MDKDIVYENYLPLTYSTTFYDELNSKYGKSVCSAIDAFFITHGLTVASGDDEKLRILPRRKKIKLTFDV